MKQSEKIISLVAKQEGLEKERKEKQFIQSLFETLADTTALQEENGVIVIAPAFTSETSDYDASIYLESIKYAAERLAAETELAIIAEVQVSREQGDIVKITIV